MSKRFPGYHQVHIPEQTNVSPDISIPPIIVRAKPYVYATEKDIHHPNAKIKIVADIWHAPGSLKDHSRKKWGGSKSALVVNHIPRCEVDVENCKIIKKDGSELCAINLQAVIDSLREAIFR